MAHLYRHALWTIQEHTASCTRCRCLVILTMARRRPINPYSSDRDRISRAVGADAAQGFQVPGGSPHRNCRAFDWAAKPRRETSR